MIESKQWSDLLLEYQELIEGSYGSTKTWLILIVVFVIL